MKAHLDSHFHQNNEIRMKKKVAQDEVSGNRPLFSSFGSWVNQGARSDDVIPSTGAKEDTQSKIVAGATGQSIAKGKYI